MTVQIKTIENESQLIQVISLGDSHSNTLGFYPEGAFIRSFKAKQIIIAETETNEIAGYVLYGIAKRQKRLRVTHCCVSEDHRGQNIARKLVGFLEKKEKHLAYVELNCREDYDANKFWPEVGFNVAGYKDGRGKEAKRLVIWRKVLSKEPSLLSYLDEHVRQNKIIAVLDNNIIIDIFDKRKLECSLCDNWLTNDVEYYITPETPTELHRDEDIDRRNSTRDIAKQFIEIEEEHSVFQSIYDTFSNFDAKTERDISDKKQLAWAIAGNANYFISNDNDLINKFSEYVDEKYNLRIFRPHEFMICIDEIVNEKDYNPASFSNSEILESKLSSEEIDNVLNVFQKVKEDEKKSHFRNLLSATVSPKDGTAITFRYEEEYLGLIGYKIDNNVLFVETIRLNNKHKLASTIAYQLVYYILYHVSYKTSSVDFIRVNEPQLHEDISEALLYFGFFKGTDCWHKINIKDVLSANDIIEFLQDILPKLNIKEESIEEWKNAVKSDDSEEVYRNELNLWPCKIADSNIDNFVVPIRPYWATELFDEDLASQSLWRRKLHLAINPFLIYYRSTSGTSIDYPARLLWYVSDEKNVAGTKCIKACSYLEKVEVDCPKQLFKKYSNYGIYEWEDVSATSNGDMQEKIMVLVFRNTECFSNSVAYNKVKDIYTKFAIKDNNFQCPQKITNEAFLEIYRNGTSK